MKFSKFELQISFASQTVTFYNPFVGAQSGTRGRREGRAPGSLPHRVVARALGAPHEVQRAAKRLVAQRLPGRT